MSKLNNLIGRRFGRLLVTERGANNDRGRATWICKCDCGNVITSSGDSLLRGHTSSCKCYYIESRTGDNNPAKRPEVREKISIGLMGRQYSEETRTKISAARRGKPGKRKDLTGVRFGRLVVLYRDPINVKKWFCQCDCGAIKSIARSSLVGELTTSCGCYNKEIASRPRTIETKIKIGDANRGHHHTEETKRVLANAHIGRHQTEEAKEKISKAHRGKMVSCETRAKMSIAQRGEKHPNWQGGLTEQSYCEKWTPELRERIRAFFEYRCIACGKSQVENKRLLPCHHVEYDKRACCSEGEWKFAALCSKCHGKTSHERDRWCDILSRIIDEIYAGKSYFTREEYDSLTNT